MTHNSCDIYEGPVIKIGLEYSTQIELSEPIFAAGTTFVSDVREKATSPDPLATLSTENGGLVRISDTVIEIRIPAAATATAKVGSVVLDMIRTDVSPSQHLGFTMEIPVEMSITRGV